MRTANKVLRTDEVSNRNVPGAGGRFKKTYPLCPGFLT